MCFGLAEKVLQYWSFGPRRQRRGGLRLGWFLHSTVFQGGILHRRIFRRELRRFLLGKLFAPRLELLLGKAFGVELEGHAVCGAAAEQASVRDQAGFRSVEVRNERALRIRCDRRDRAGARSEAESMQSECRSPRVERHDVSSFEFEFLP